MPNTLPNGLPRYYADRLRNGEYTPYRRRVNWRNSDSYDIIDRLQGFRYPIKRVHSAYEMERELIRLND